MPQLERTYGQIALTVRLTTSSRLQDRITTNVVGAILPMLEQAEIKRAQRKPTGSLDA